MNLEKPSYAGLFGAVRGGWPCLYGWPVVSLVVVHVLALVGFFVVGGLLHQLEVVDNGS